MQLLLPLIMPVAVRCLALPLECIQAEVSCNILYAGPRVCCVKAIITDTACIVMS